MAFNLNPMGLNGPNKTPKYLQPDYRIPTVNANVASYPVGTNMLGLTLPVAAYTQPDFRTNAPTPTVFYPTRFWSS
jgi:hypothetical protein